MCSNHQIPPVLHGNPTGLRDRGYHVINVPELIVRHRVGQFAVFALVSNPSGVTGCEIALSLCWHLITVCDAELYNTTASYLS